MQIFGLTTSRGPLAVRTASRLADVGPLLARAEAASREGRWAVVAVAYDAALAFEPALQVASPTPDYPLAWLAEFDQLTPAPAARANDSGGGNWPEFAAAMTEGDFCSRVRRVQEYIRGGDTYQVNLTFPMYASAPPDPEAWFEHLYAVQPAPYAAYLELGRHVVLSLSPELFFEVLPAELHPDSAGRGAPGATRRRLIRTRPMKGTVRRGRWLAEDEALATALAASRKTQAENVMIVDLLRNDIGRVAETGSVHVPRLFDVERYPTLWQMTSTVEGTLRDGVTLADIFAALFPCGSVTGAPKIRTMEIIRELESSPRGAYTGAIGLLAPDGRWTCSVAIRTVIVDRESGRATLNVGAGITNDSVPEEEYAECLLKAAFAAPGPGDATFHLLETMRLEDGRILRLERHLRRMRDSSRYFGFAWDERLIREQLDAEALTHPQGVWRLRLTVDHAGGAETVLTPHQDVEGAVWRVAFASTPVDDRDQSLFNKTTRRTVYEAARRARPDVDDVLLMNARRELTESTIANVVVEIDGQRWTPPVTCGLLGGVMREELLERGDIQERIISRGEVMRASRLWLINSLRGWIEAEVVR